MKVIVGGGGLGGLSAATVLAEAGHEVVVIERESFAGGRVGSWKSRLASGDAFHMERGFHAFFRQYYNLRSLMRRVDPQLSMLEPQLDYPVFGPNGRVESFSGLSTKAPFNIAQLVWRTPTLGLRDLLGVNAKNASSMLGYGAHTYDKWDHISARTYLDSLRFPEDARQMLFDVFSHSFFNPEDKFSAAELLMQFHFYFMGNPEGLIFDTMTKPFGPGFIEPLLGYLRGLGVELRLGESVERLEIGDQLSMTSGGRDERADAAILALPVGPLKTVVEASTGFDARFRAQVESLETTLPFVVWRMWLNKPVKKRPPFAGTVGLGLLDNISIYEKLEDESAAWAHKQGGSVVELHAYGVPANLDEAAIRADLIRALHTLYPETREAEVVEERYLHRQDCPAFAPGSDAQRPGVQTSDPRVFLAGDFVKVPWPSALMERATMSGFDAANRVHGKVAQPIRSVPERGLLHALQL
ncbi:MAG: isorenieratene synthase [Polyangiales bacterium]|jgi:isorenieratene synthase